MLILIIVYASYVNLPRDEVEAKKQGGLWGKAYEKLIGPIQAPKTGTGIVYFNFVLFIISVTTDPYRVGGVTEDAGFLAFSHDFPALARVWIFPRFLPFLHDRGIFT